MKTIDDRRNQNSYVDGPRPIRGSTAVGRVRKDFTEQRSGAVADSPALHDLREICAQPATR